MCVTQPLKEIMWRILGNKTPVYGCNVLPMKVCSLFFLPGMFVGGCRNPNRYLTVVGFITTAITLISAHLLLGGLMIDCSGRGRGSSLKWLL